MAQLDGRQIMVVIAKLYELPKYRGKSTTGLGASRNVPSVEIARKNLLNLIEQTSQKQTVLEWGMLSRRTVALRQKDLTHRLKS